MRESILAAWTFAQHDDLEGLSSLVPSDVDPNSSTYSLENHVHTLLMAAAAHGAQSCAAYLIENDAKVDQKNFLGFTALHWTAFSGRTEVVDLLLENGADLEARTEDGKTTVHIAAARGHIQYLSYIVEKGADLMAIASNGWSALQFSVVGNFQKVFQFLLSRNCNPDVFDVARKTVYDVAQLYNRGWAIQMFEPEEEERFETQGIDQSFIEEEDRPPPQSGGKSNPTGRKREDLPARQTSSSKEVPLGEDASESTLVSSEDELSQRAPSKRKPPAAKEQKPPPGNGNPGNGDDAMSSDSQRPAVSERNGRAKPAVPRGKVASAEQAASKPAAGDAVAAKPAPANRRGRPLNLEDPPAKPTQQKTGPADDEVPKGTTAPAEKANAKSGKTNPAPARDDPPPEKATPKARRVNPTSSREDTPAAAPKGRPQADELAAPQPSSKARPPPAEPDGVKPANSKAKPPPAEEPAKASAPARRKGATGGEAAVQPSKSKERTPPDPEPALDAPPGAPSARNRRPK
jgi:hypothetical protein